MSTKIVFACTCPHPPLLLPGVGSEQDREKIKQTITALQGLGEGLKKASPELIIIFSPHPEWGFEVPLYFLAPYFSGKIKKILTGLESPQYYFDKGKNLELPSQRIALIASGDTSHVLKEQGPYGFHSDGPSFDQELKQAIQEKDIPSLLNLDKKYPQAAECGLRSFAFLLGILTKVDYQPQILSYENSFGVGYLTIDFQISYE